MVLNENFGGESALRPKSSGITNNIGKILYLCTGLSNEPKYKWNIGNKLHRKKKKPFVLTLQMS